MKAKRKLLFSRSSFLIISIFCWGFLNGISAAENGLVNVHVGVILDLGSVDGVVYNSSISMAVEDFYRTIGRDYRTRLILHYQDSKSSVVEAASAAFQLMRTFDVKAILGPQTSEEADFLAHMGTEAHIPIVSFAAVSSLISPSRTPYFIRVAQNDSTQSRPISAILTAFNWKDVILIHDDSYSGNALIPYLADSIQEAGSVIFRRIALSSSANEAGIRQTVRDFAVLPARVFVVHLPVSLAGIFFRLVSEAGMMEDGYAWIVTSRVANRVKSMDPSTLTSVEGVLGIKTYVPISLLQDNFRVRLKQNLRKEHPDVDVSDIDVYALWAYDATWATALAAEKAFSAGVSPEANSTKFIMGTEVSPIGSSKLLHALSDARFHGLTGKIDLAEAQLNSSSFEIINVVSDGGERKIGYWTPSLGLCRSLSIEKNFSTKSEDLAEIIWPGGNTQVPKSPVGPSNVTFLRIGVPVKTGYNEFVKVKWDPKLKRNVTEGYVVDIFLRLLDSLPYKVLPDFQPYDNGHVDELGYYDELIYQVYLKTYDAVVGDTTINPNRSNYVDFTQPYVDSRITMIVPVVDADVTKKFWWFLAPLSMALWLATIGMSVLKGILIWFFEHSKNKEFQGTKAEQVGKILYFSFTIFVFANREKLKTNHARFISSLWTFVVFVLVTSYGANLTSILTVEKLRPKVTDLQTLINNKEKIGCQNGSFVLDFLKKQGADESNIKAYASVAEYAKALDLGSDDGGVSAIVDEIPYIKVFLKYNCRNYTMAGKTYRTGGFGFAFARGSALVSDASRAVLQFDEVEMNEIESKWFGNTTCPDPLEAVNINYELTLGSFRFIYLTTLSISAATMILYLINISFEERKRARIAAEGPAEDSETDDKDSDDDEAQAAVDDEAGASSPAGSAYHSFEVEGSPRATRARN
ncbi:hypothetical protein H6P81_000499 [Aristolochia fimbriata]|uniref:Glutamate receptor n=1 Tax=Aristolochia fimbriata TaxID=158543 RepID=A0AAV7F5I5_ARIFI|nr:hypothetical protein H6P81_000499 [Aristolochia fimbriata]